MDGDLTEGNYSPHPDTIWVFFFLNELILENIRVGY